MNRIGGSESMISDKLLKQLNDQMNFEFYSSHAYLAMAAYCSKQSLDGFANFFIVQAEEERFHAMKIYHFIHARGERAVLTGFDTPEGHYESLLEAFEHAYNHEKLVTQKIYDLSDLAVAEREHATIHFLKWFIDEQVEEEAIFDNVIGKLKLVGNDGNGLFLMDSEFAKRSFTPPVEA
jgi:ferritin